MSVVVFSANDIGAEGAKAIGEALKAKANETVTTVDLMSEKYYIFIYETISFLNVCGYFLRERNWR